MVKKLWNTKCCGLLVALVLHVILLATSATAAQSALPADIPPADAPVITLAVKQGETVTCYLGAEDATPVWVESAPNVFQQVTADTPAPEIQVTASGTTINIYGAITYMNCSGNGDKLTALDVRGNTLLTNLVCGDNSLTSLDVSRNAALATLVCFGLPLTALDVSQNVQLRLLNCSDCQLTTLDVSKNAKLKYLYCQGNRLTALDVHLNTTLEELDCSANQLAALDVRRNTSLKILNCANNRLTSLELGAQDAIKSLNTDGNPLAAAVLKPVPAATLQHLPRKGKVVDSASYSDSTGDNAVVLTQTPVSQRKDGEILCSSRDLYAYRFQNVGGEFTQIWRITDFMHECDGDLTAEFVPNSLSITDLDNNGVNEVWVVYLLGCRTDVMPLDMKIIMYEGSQKYAVRGKQYEASIGEGGEYTMDKVFANGPSEFRTYAEGLWRKYAMSH